MSTITGLPANSILYTGASITDRPVKGCHEIKPGSLALIPAYGTGQGTLKAWTTPGNKYLPMFRAQWQKYGSGARGIWIMFCDHDKDYQSNVAVLEQQARQHLADVRAIVGPTPTFYLSPMPAYADTPCRQVVNAVKDTTALVAKFVSEGLGVKGPVLTALHSTQQVGCDPNKAGRQVQGADLVRFFG